ncbi:MAG TPA: hypothetical protein VHQ42_03460 [Candidatus Limnocylindria bacterium]|nr:hypothetical protein [Candidatus Limnocylindria bacterium]
MNWRAIGCGTLAAAVFVLVGVIGIWRASAPAECPSVLPYQPASYRPVGEATDEPLLTGVDEDLVLSGRTSFGLAGWDVWIEPDRAPLPSGQPLPQRIVLACGDGTYQAYQRGTE